MNQSITERRGFDAAPDGSATDGDGLELGYHGRHYVVPETFGHQLGVRRHPLHFNITARGVHAQHIVEVAHIESLCLNLLAVAEQIGGAFAQTDTASTAGTQKFRQAPFLFFVSNTGHSCATLHKTL